ncbi:MAG: winged helix-turn-helix domain-containing protein [Nitrososphaerales archaeon]
MAVCEFGIAGLEHGIRRRTWRDIVASILERLLKAPSTQNKVMTSTNLNRDTAGIYLQEMISMRFVRIFSESKDHKVYSATEKGKRWLRIYKSLLDEEESKD